MKHKISVLITTYRRFKNLKTIFKAWLRQPVDQVWIINGNPKVKLDWGRPPQSMVINMPCDLGTKMDYGFALLTEGDLIILADDDVVPLPGFVPDLFQGWKQVGGGIVGILGRTFHGPTYWGETKFYRASLIQAPVRVGFCGVVYFAPRNLFGFDVRGLPRNCDDLWWQMKIFPDVTKHVVPTVAYKNLPEAGDASAMYKQPHLRAQRETFFREHYMKSYAPEGRIY